jgi:hypothetical protein
VLTTKLSRSVVATVPAPNAALALTVWLFPVAVVALTPVVVSTAAETFSPNGK